MLIEDAYTLREFLADFGSLASIIGLGLTLLVYLGVKKIKNDYIFRLRSPQFLRFMQVKTKEVNKLAENFSDNGKLISDELAKVDVKLSFMIKRTNKSAKESITELGRYIKAYEQAPDDRDKFNQAFRQMLRVIEEIREMQKDLDLE